MSGSSDPVFEDVEAFCSVSHAQAILSLRVVAFVRGDFVSSSPTSCSSEVGCSRGTGCLLLAIRICTSRIHGNVEFFRTCGTRNQHLREAKEQS